MTELEAMQHQRDDARAERDSFERQLQEAMTRIGDLVNQLEQVEAAIAMQEKAFSEQVAEVKRLRGLLDAENAKTLKLESQLAVEKGRPGHDSYRDDLLKVVCAMVSSFNPDASFDPKNVAYGAGVLLDHVYAAAQARKETKL